MGNSEVGHLNIGSGRVIRMDVSLVDHEIETGEFFRNKVLTKAMEGAKTRGKALHLMGLILTVRSTRRSLIFMRC